MAEAHGVEAHGIWTVAEQDQAWATADEGGAERRTDAFMKVICIAPNGRSGYASPGGGRVGALDRRAALAERAARKALARGRAGRAAARASTRWCSSRRRSAGCSTCSGLTAFNGLAHAEGRGALVGRLGDQVAAPAINLADSPDHRARRSRARSTPRARPRRRCR